MTYYPTLDEDLARAKEILANNERPAVDHHAAYKLLESFVAAIERLQRENDDLVDETENDAMRLGGMLKERDAEIERLRLPGPLSGLQHAKYLNPACGEHGCQWLTATYENNELRDKLAAYHAAANDPEPDR